MRKFWLRHLTIAKLLLVVFGGITAVLLVLLIFHAWGYYMLQETIILDVMEKKTVERTTERCAYRENEYATCSQYTTITNTQYFIVTPNEDFVVNERLYQQVEVGRRYKVVVSGWKWLEMPRNVIEVTNK